MSNSKCLPSSTILIAKHLKDIERTILESADHTYPAERTKFSFFLRLALWAEKIKKEPCDSIAQIEEFLDDLSPNILCDNLSEVWFKIQDLKNQVRCSNSEVETYLGLITDSTGYETFLELCLIHFLTLMLCPISLGSSGVRFSLRNDLNIKSLISQMSEPDQDSALQDLATTWKSFIESDFWLPDLEIYDRPMLVDHKVYKFFSTFKLIFFKGETHYRQLVGDKKWHPLTPFRSALQDFQPAPLVALRTIKSDIIAGIEDINVFAKINNNELPRDWISSGDYGLIQYHDPSR